MRTNEEIEKEWHKVAVKEFHMMEQYQYLVSRWWLSQRLQDLQSIKEDLKGICNKCRTERGLATAIGNYIHKLDTLLTNKE